MRYQTIQQLIKDRANQNPEALAILAPGCLPLTYQALGKQVEAIGSRLNELGIGQGDRVAIVLPNGPEMAAAFLSVACTAAAAPLNPNYRAEEFDFYLSDLDVKLLIVQQGANSPAGRVARERGIAVVELVADAGGPAGLFSLNGNGLGRARESLPPQPEDAALMLHTSGTTSRPKMVPLSQHNLCASIENISQSLALTKNDRCLNVMPLFHIHGLAAALLSSIFSGGSVVCTPGFQAPSFFNWVDEFKPSWYTAVPTMHQSILGRAKENRQIAGRSAFRFIRSCSASLPPQVMADLEGTFGVPVVEAYGMTEASHQMACNPLPPRKRKPGSVGIATGTGIGILPPDGDTPLAVGERGEVVVRGPGITAGYVNNADANARSFTSQGWFRTGDQGYLDDEGYLFLTGRLKEIINRGGEKISPREVEEVLLDHPAVSQALVFAMPDAQLGEEIGAAVVIRDAAVNEKALRQYCAVRLVDFKVPRRIVILDEIPKGPTGKPQRIGLAEKLGLSGQQAADEAAPMEPALKAQTAVERLLADLWCEVLILKSVGVNHRFLDLGGDSVMAARLAARLEQQLDIKMSLVDFFDLPTIAQQATWVEEKLLE